MITLFGETLWESPFVMTVVVTLKEKSLTYTERALDLAAGEQRSGDFPVQSLTGRVPTLSVDGFVLSESLAIVEYLEERFSPPVHARVLPESREDRARARQILGWLRSDLAALRRERPTSTIFFSPTDSPLPPDAQADAGKLIRVATQLLSGKSSLFDTWSIADADLTIALMRLIANGDPVPAPLADYATLQWERPSIKAFRDHPRG